jgi:hypothetical protein
MKAESVLGVFAKWPTPGKVKTRLAAMRNDAWAARVASAFLADTLDRLVQVSCRRVVAFAPDDAQQLFAELVAGRYELMPQGAGNLGDRLERFVDRCLASGASGVVVVGADSPTLPLTLIEQAFSELARSDAVLGPAADGGFYLFGSRRPPGPLLRGIDWESARTLRQVNERISAASWDMALLPPWYDVDDEPAWNFLRDHIAAMRSAGLEPATPRTEGLVREDAGHRRDHRV